MRPKIPNWKSSSARQMTPTHSVTSVTTVCAQRPTTSPCWSFRTQLRVLCLRSTRFTNWCELSHAFHRITQPRIRSIAPSPSICFRLQRHLAKRGCRLRRNKAVHPGVSIFRRPWRALPNTKSVLSEPKTGPGSRIFSPAETMASLPQHQPPVTDQVSMSAWR
jgi:hypothetical protein